MLLCCSFTAVLSTLYPLISSSFYSIPVTGTCVCLFSPSPMLDLCDFGHFTVANNAVVVSSLEDIGALWPVWG